MTGIRQVHWAMPMRIAGIVGVVAVIALVLLVWPFNGHPTRLVTPVYALDYGLFLNGIAGQTEQWRRFTANYDFRGVSLEEARQRLRVPLIAPKKLPGGLTLQEVHLLKSGCCQSAALKYLYGDRVLYVFQQPLGHPISFGERKVEDPPRWCDSCKLVRSKGYRLLQWEEGERGFVVIANLPEQELVTVVTALRPAPRVNTMSTGQERR